MASLKGQCFCGAVELSVTGAPEAMGYCHCASCRSWAAAPINAFSLWKQDVVKVTKGVEHIGVFHKTDRSHRQFCKLCGGHLMTAHPQWQLIDVYAAVLPGLKFEPKLHVNYGEKVVAMRDGLPKLKALTELGDGFIVHDVPPERKVGQHASILDRVVPHGDVGRSYLLAGQVHPNSA